MINTPQRRDKHANPQDTEKREITKGRVIDQNNILTILIHYLKKKKKNARSTKISMPFLSVDNFEIAHKTS